MLAVGAAEGVKKTSGPPSPGPFKWNGPYQFRKINLQSTKIKSLTFLRDQRYHHCFLHLYISISYMKHPRKLSLRTNPRWPAFGSDSSPKPVGTCIEHSRREN